MTWSTQEISYKVKRCWHDNTTFTRNIIAGYGLIVTTVIGTWNTYLQVSMHYSIRKLHFTVGCSALLPIVFVVVCYFVLVVL